MPNRYRIFVAYKYLIKLERSLELAKTQCTQYLVKVNKMFMIQLCQTCTGVLLIGSRKNTANRM